MNTPQEVITNWSAKVLADSKISTRLNAVYKFVVNGAGGGTWVFSCKGQPSISSGDAPADCTITMGASDFVALANGELNPQMAFMSGKLDIEGDMELALRLGEIMG